MSRNAETYYQARAEALGIEPPDFPELLHGTPLPLAEGDVISVHSMPGNPSVKDIGGTVAAQLDTLIPFVWRGISPAVRLVRAVDGIQETSNASAGVAALEALVPAGRSTGKLSHLMLEAIAPEDIAASSMRQLASRKPEVAPGRDGLTHPTEAFAMLSARYNRQQVVAGLLTVRATVVAESHYRAAHLSARIQAVRVPAKNISGLLAEEQRLQAAALRPPAHDGEPRAGHMRAGLHVRGGPSSRHR